jgi:PAS domain S-box-containing protein
MTRRRRNLDDMLARVFAGDSEMAGRMRAFDWPATPLGPVEGWSRSLRIAIRIMLASRQPIWIGWGEDLTYLYNDPYKAIIGGKHPEMLGQPTRVVWRELWDTIGPMLTTVLRGNEGTYDESLLLIMERHGYREETYYTFSYSPIPADDGSAGGIICANTDDTRRVIGERQLALLREVASQTAEARTLHEVCTLGADALRSNPRDIPFAMLYLADADEARLSLAATSGIEPEHPAAPAAVELAGDGRWPFAAAFGRRDIVVADGRRFEVPLPTGAWDEPPVRAALVPLSADARLGRGGILVVGLNPFRQFDAAYADFLRLVGGQLSASIAAAAALETERTRAETLAELDRAKTVFFSNVSHEFRTPLTLMLGPLEETLEAPDLPAEHRETLQVAQRNTLRLLRLVNTLLDFARLEANRAEAVYEEIDVAGFTRDVSSAFRSAVERAGLSLVVQCDQPREPVFVDRGMWEKVVLNLLSNAFKFTFAGTISVTLADRGEHVELVVSDTGVGIPPGELRHVFERFHRVRGTEGRTHEGTGIGLALVSELVKLHGGEVTATSEPGRGSAFRVRIPTGSAHLPRERIGAARTSASTDLGAAPFVEEALRWLPDADSTVPDQPTASPGIVQTAGERILVADDNADMRDYVSRLLSQHWRVEAVEDGEAALGSIREHPPDLVVADVMMPRLDGLGLLRTLRADSGLASLPVILVSARAGEESRIEGLGSGADDYLTKPFSARELIARVDAHLKLARLRREALEIQEALADELRGKTAEQMAATAKFQSVFNQSAIFAGIMSPEGTLKEVNELALSGCGYRREQVIDRPFWETPWWRCSDEVKARIRVATEHAASGTPFRELLPYWWADGTQRLVDFAMHPIRDENGTVLFLHPTGIDVTERTHAEQAIRHRSEQFETLVNQAPLGVFLVDADLRMVQVNPIALPVVPDLPGGIIGEDLDRIVHRMWEQPVADEIVGIFRHTLETGESYVTGERGEYRIDRGVFEHYEWRVDRIKLPNGRFGLVCYFRDIGEQVEARRRIVASEEAARRAQLEAETANRAKDDFLATVSHELRSPLQGILGWLTLLKRGQLDGIQTTRALESVERSVRLQAQLVHDLMDISRIVAGKVEIDRTPLDLAALLTTTAEEFMPGAVSRTIDLQLRVEPSGLVVGDRERLHQVVANLLTNALKFTPAGGRVTLSCRREDDAVVIQVKDTGQGIVREFLPRLFDRFTQADTSSTRRFGGLGLGLAIVRHLVELHGGSVSAQSAGIRQGATFIVRVPAALPAADTRHPRAQGARPTLRLDDVEILLVEDDRDALEAMTLALEMTGATVRSASSAAEAWSEFIRRAPDIVVSDLSMPEEDGYSLLRRIQGSALNGSVPAIALTGFTRPEDKARVLSAGFAAHVPKPIDPDLLVRVLADVLASSATPARSVR